MTTPPHVRASLPVDRANDRIRLPWRAGLAALLCALAAPAYAFGQTRPSELAGQSLEDLMKIVVTTATRGGHDAATAPASVTVVTSDELLRRGYRSLADVLKDLSEFKTDIAGDQDYPVEFTVRGTRGSSRIVILIDGARITSPTGEPIPIFANYPVHMARQIEIVVGSTSALYGADAFSAVVNIITKTAEESTGLTVSASAGQFGLTNYTGSFGRTFGTRAGFTISGQLYRDQQPDLSRYYPADFAGLASQRTGVFNTIYGPMTSGTPLKPDYDIPASAHSVHAAFTFGGFEAMLFENRSHLSTTPAYRPDNGVYNREAFTANELVVGSASYKTAIGRVKTETSLTFSRHEMDPNSGYWNVFSNMTKSFKYAYGSSWNASEQLTWAPSASTTITAGAEFERLHAIPQTADLNQPIRSRTEPGTILGTSIVDEFNDLHYDNTAAYAQLQHSWSPRVALTVGARVDSNTRYEATLNPRAALVVEPRDGTVLKFMAGTAYLAPSPFQAYAHYGSFYSVDGGRTYRSEYWHVPNPDLRPQHKRSAEAEWTQRIRSNVTATATVFAARITDLIDAAGPGQAGPGTYLGWPVSYVDHAVNDGREDSYGITVRTNWLRRWTTARLNVHAALTAVGGEFYDIDDDFRLPLGSLSTLQWRAGLDLDLGRWSVAPRLIGMNRQRLVATIDEGRGLERRTLAGYTTLDLSVRREHVVRGVSAFLLLENAFDARYRNINARAYTNPEELIGAPQNPRRLTIGLQIGIK